MKKVLALGVAALMAVGAVATLASCGGESEEKLKVGLITLHDKQSTYDKNFIEAMETACANKDVELVLKTGIEEDSTCYDAAADLADNGCKLVFADSFGHEKFMIQAAKEFTDVEFCHATGTHSKTEGVANFHNAFASIYEGRYLAGVVGGMKLVEMYNAGKILDSNKTEEGAIKIGYVGAYTYAEVVSGYTAWYLGVQSVLKDVGLSAYMDVTFTGSWYDEKAEREAANTLISRGCALISQHADSMGAPSACETAGVPNVSYNGSTASQCPNTFLVSSKINWVPYFEYIIDCVKEGKKIETDWTGTIETGSVQLTELGKNVAAGTAEKLEAVKADLKSGKIQVFDTANFTVKHEKVLSYLADVQDMGDYKGETEAIKTANGITYFAESSDRSAPYFDLQIDGINLLNTKF